MSHTQYEQDILFRKPKASDGLAVYQLIKRSPPLDLNSSYNYHLLCRHFAETCVVAEHAGKVVGFISAYMRPDTDNTLFVWQVAVDSTMRGRGLAKALLSALLERPACRDARYLETTVTPSNAPSMGLFTKFAHEHGYALHESVFLEAADFGPQAHEAEMLLHIGPLAA